MCLDGFFFTQNLFLVSGKEISLSRSRQGIKEEENCLQVSSSFYSPGWSDTLLLVL